MKKLIQLLIINLLLITSVYASGGIGGGGIANIPQGQDREKYHLGKAVYNQDITLEKQSNVKSIDQEERLEYLQGSLPNTEKRRVNLPDFAGKLSEEQLQALEYFIQVRFNVKLPEKKKE
ncbi:hypothetical protein ND861_11895 [Leptospira sp. 2 VSF19]|uniref:Uncharacterized protein n=1 Tax=Leptospira soteropolitanensis TaxID=2950025 RepID=A0AAW5VIL4_9LEPT|nr:hypothetical protein [Leptospira soteropolitanensis]MCW7493339.1 hypothetical protein [Leptospira soteropolitanensis]MCW7501129.1 hypothetical protein [Leptospira soteropolitanensis]MCW7523191.1 hypothetical protein [Leptospira soteropolitanensis]MCW7527052.1 hypothetical protein [Leptospira soteropolitanensis]MCW7530909.1 hypothetical protein [Leptospira soteropolitanensis]